MKRLYNYLHPRITQQLFSWIILSLFVSVSHQLMAQDSNLSCNTFTSTNLTTSTFTSLSATGWTNPGNVINTSTTDFANTNTNGAVLRISDANTYNSAGYYVGVRVGRPAGLTNSGDITVRTLLGTTQQDTYTVNLGIGGISGSAEDIGFYTTKPFNAIEIVNGSTNTTRVYYAFLQRFCSYDLPCNSTTAFTRTNFPAQLDPDRTGVSGVLNLVATTGLNNDNLVDNDPSTVATIIPVASFAGSVSVAVKDPVNDYPAGTYAGFDIANNVLVGLGILNAVSFTTYRDGNQIETISGSSLLVSAPLLNASGRQTVGFVAKSAFDEIQITFTQSGVTLGTITIYNAVLKQFCNGPDLACNTRTILNSATYPVLIDVSNTGLTGTACASCGIQNTSNIIDGDANSAATVVLTGSVNTSASVGVKNQLQTYPAGTYAGFDIQTSTIASVGVADNIIVTLYNNGSAVQTSNSNTILLGASVLSGGNTRQTVGVVSTVAFNEAKITFVNTAGISLGNISVFSAVAKRFCNGPDLACNTQTILDETVYPVYVNPANTGFTAAVCVGCTIAGTGNVIDNSSSTAATISTAATAGSQVSLSVKNQLQTYPAGTFAGFDVETRSLASLDLLGSVTITLYNNGTAVQTGTGSALILGATSSALTGNSRQIIGLASTVDFNEAKITFTRIAGIDLGTTYVYSAVIQRSCAATVACNTTYYLSNPTFPSVINSARTGVLGGACVACAVENPANVINSTNTDFATLRSTVGAITQTSLSVQDPVGTYPAGSYAGFVIKKNNFIAATALLPSITITTYNNGIVAESNSSGNLLDLTLLFNIFGTGNGTFNIGFATTKPFDEVQISVGAIASGLDQFVDVYSSFIDTRTAFTCFKLNPDFAVTNKGVSVSGSLKTNDLVNTGTTYSSSYTLVSGPAGATPALTVNADGSYTFNSATAGVYVYQIPVCPSGQTASCPLSTFQVTVVDPSVTNNAPTANPDIASTSVGIPVLINVKANDAPGNAGGTLGSPVIVVQPTSGTATVNNTGSIVYTPAANTSGTFSFTYAVVESPSNTTATAQVTVTVEESGVAFVTTADDFARTAQNTPVSGNVLTNDFGTSLTVSNPGTFTVAGKGSLTLDQTGSFTFIPTSGVTGPVDFTYTACDNSTTAICGTATIHILVVPVSDLTPIIYALPTIQYGTSNLSAVVNVIELNSFATNRPTTVYVTKDPRIALTFDPTDTFVGGKSVQNSAWTFDGTTSSSYYILTTNQTIAAGSVLSFGLKGVLTAGATEGKTTISTVILGGSGGEVRVNNNNDADKIDYFRQQ